jgi:hypothetical protein
MCTRLYLGKGERLDLHLEWNGQIPLSLHITCQLGWIKLYNI